MPWDEVSNGLGKKSLEKAKGAGVVRTAVAGLRRSW